MITEPKAYFLSRSWRDANDCWNWIGNTDKNGYGVIERDGKKLFAHRVSLHSTGINVTDRFVCHKCDNPACVNPDHLFAGTPSDNVQDMISKGRKVEADRKGTKNPNSKLNENLVREIASAEGSQQQIADRFGISQRTVSRIKRNETWLHMEALDG